MADVERQGSVLGGIIGPSTEILAMAGAMALIGRAHVALIQHNLLSGDQLMVVGVVLIRILPLMNQVYGVMGQISYTSGGVREALRWLDSPLVPSRPFGAREWTGCRGCRPHEPAAEGITARSAAGRARGECSKLRLRWAHRPQDVAGRPAWAGCAPASAPGGAGATCQRSSIETPRRVRVEPSSKASRARALL